MFIQIRPTAERADFEHRAKANRHQAVPENARAGEAVVGSTAAGCAWKRGGICG
jgi:hypothetical protein